jgi:hypothetical protein
MSLRRSVAAAVAVATVSLASAAWASPWALQPGEFYSELSGSSRSATSFYRNEDEQRTLLGGELFDRVVRSHTEMGWKKRASIWFDVPFVSRSWVSGPVAATSTGFGDFEFGIRWGLHRGDSPLALNLGWSAPLGGNRRLFPGTSGDGGLDATALATLASGTGRDSSTFFSQGMQTLSASLELGGALGGHAHYALGGGYRTRYLSIGSRATTDRYADFATGTASLGWWLSKNLLVTGNFAGEWQVSQGESYDRIAAPIPGSNGPELQSVSMLAGERVTYRIDERMDVFAGSWHTPSGRNTLHADQFYCGIAWKQTAFGRSAGALGGSKAN